MAKVKSLIGIGQKWKYEIQNEWYLFEVIEVSRSMWGGGYIKAKVYGASAHYATWPGREYTAYLDDLDVEEGVNYLLLSSPFSFGRDEDTPVFVKKELTEQEKQMKFFFPELWEAYKKRKGSK